MTQHFDTELGLIVMCVYIVPEEGEERRSGRSYFFWPNANRTVIDGKKVVSSTDDGTSPACLHPLLINKMFYEDDIHPEIQVCPAIFGDPPRTFLPTKS